MTETSGSSGRPSGTATSGTRLHARWTGISVAVIAILLLFTLVIVKPAMPDRIALLAGPAGSADHTLALRYAADLKRRGLDAEVVVTAGEFDSWRRVSEDSDAVAFLPSAILRGDQAGLETEHLVALGSIGYSPLWLFHRADLEFTRVRDLAGRRVATEGAETADDHIVRRLIEVNGLTGEVELRPGDGQSAGAIIEGFRAGTLDAAFVMGASDSDLVRGLLDSDAARFASFDRADAYAARLPGVIPLSAPEGVFDLARDVPPRDARLLAAVNCLVAHEGLHPAVAPMLLVTARNVHATTVFSTASSFPGTEHVMLPLDRGARRYFERGQTGLSAALPYRVARWAEHLGFFVIPLLAVAALLLKAVPAGLRIWGELRLRRMFKQLEAVEKGNAAGRDRAKLLGSLDRLDRASATMFVPMAIVQDYIDFRQFLHDMRERVAAGGADASDVDRVD